MDDSDIILEEIDSRNSFILEITIRNLLDYNNFLKKYHE